MGGKGAALWIAEMAAPSSTLDPEVEITIIDNREPSVPTMYFKTTVPVLGVRGLTLER